MSPEISYGFRSARAEILLNQADPDSYCEPSDKLSASRPTGMCPGEPYPDAGDEGLPGWRKTTVGAIFRSLARQRASHDNFPSGS